MPSAYQIHGRKPYPWTTPDGISNLRLNKNVPIPTKVPAGHALVRIRAAALNARDMMVMSHDPVYPGPHEEDLVPCCDGAGEIVGVGDGSKWKRGERVVICPLEWEDWWGPADQEGGAEWKEKNFRAKGAGNAQGTLREYGIFRDEELVRAPDHLSFEELAAIPSAGATAIHALLYGPQPLKAGQIILAQGTGGVSSFVVQIASALGATVIATSSSDAKLQQAKQLGATHTINYNTHLVWSAEVLRLTSGKGVDHTIDVAGASTIQESLRSTKKGGQISLVGFLSESKATDLVVEIILGAKTVYGVCVFTRGMLEKAVQVYVDNKALKPPVGKIYAWEQEEVHEAFKTLVRGGVVGKIVIKVGEEK